LRIANGSHPVGREATAFLHSFTLGQEFGSERLLRAKNLMDFKPINGEHSVQAATFTVAFDGSIHASAVQYLQSQKELLQDLPAVQQPQVLEMTMAGSNPVPRRVGGIQMSHLRPDGTAAWQLRLIGNELSVECTRYTRWHHVWNAARQYLIAGLEAAKVRAPRNVAIIGHHVVDVFVARTDSYDISTLLKSSDLVAPKIFRAGPTWHNHLGWFEPIDEPEKAWLIQVNIDAVRNQEGPLSSQKQLRVQIVHNQELRFTSPIAIEQAEGELDVQMNKLHSKNKSILGALLTVKMAKQIGLESKNDLAVQER
jgi:uncharacterized protein (TIGR04255 family)